MSDVKSDMKSKIRDSLQNPERTLCCILLVFLTVILFVQIINRYVLYAPFVWLEEIARISFVWMIYFAIAGASKDNRHIRVGIVDLLLPPWAVKGLTLLADAIVIAFSLVIAWVGMELVRSSIGFGDTSPVTEVPMAVIYAVIPISFALVAFRTLSWHLSRAQQARSKAYAREEVLPDI